MVKKITISVPDELHKKMQEYRGSFNFSKVFQDAMSGLIEKKEGFQKRIKEDTDMEAIIERLKKEKEESMEDSYEVGRREGVEFAKAAHYDDIMAIVHANEVGTPLDEISRLHEDDSDWYRETLNEYGIDYSEVRYGRHDEGVDKFNEGFMAAVVEFWKEIKDKL